MPTVPYPDQQRIQPTAIPGQRIANTTPGTEAFGGGSAIPANATAPITELKSVVDEATDHANQVAFTSAASALTEAKTALLYHPQTGLLNQRGQNAFGAPEEARAGWDAAVEHIQSGLTTDTQKFAFQKYALNDWASVNADVQRHVAQQRVVYDTGTTEAFTKTMTQQSVGLALDGMTSGDWRTEAQKLAQVQGNLQQVQANVGAYAKRMGKSPEETAWAVEQATSEFHSEILENAATQPEPNYVSVMDYYDRYRDQIKGDQLKVVTRLIANSTALGQGQQAGLAAMEGRDIPQTAMHHVDLNDTGDDLEVGHWSPQSVARETSPDGTPQGTPQGTPAKPRTTTEARAVVEQSAMSPKAKKAALAFIDQQAAKDASQKKADAESVATKYSAALLQGVPLSAIQKQADYLALPIGVQSQIDARAKSLAGGGNGESKTATWYKLYLMPDAELAKQNLANYIGDLSTADFQKVAERKQAYLSGTQSLDTAENKMATDNIKLSLDALWPVPKDRDTPENAVQIQAYTRAAQQEIEQTRIANGGKPLTRTQIQDAVDRVTTSIKIVKPGRFWGTNTDTTRVFNFPTASAKSGSDSVVFDQPMTNSQRSQAVQAIRQRTNPAYRPTEAEIQKEWQTVMRDQIRRTAGRP